jgi:uncharacterized cupredoxin-like copper-binding protein
MMPAAIPDEEWPSKQQENQRGQFLLLMKSKYRDVCVCFSSSSYSTAVTALISVSRSPKIPESRTEIPEHKARKSVKTVRFHTLGKVEMQHSFTMDGNLMCTTRKALGFRRTPSVGPCI